jgi:rubrerythrin
MNIIECALKMESDAKAHYEKLAEEAPVSELKVLFGMLAKAEQEHYETLKRMKEEVDPSKAEFRALDEAACAFKPLLGKRDLMAELKDDSDGYLHVVKEEEESVRFYEDLAAKAENEETRQLLMLLADQEKRHLNMVENIYAFVENPRTYLEWG